MVRKILGIILSIVGLIALALSRENLKKLIPITFPEMLSSTTLLIIGAILIVLGVLLLIKSESKRGRKEQPEEVPVLEGDRIVAYRRV